jgi:hypothetical protein
VIRHAVPVAIVMSLAMIPIGCQSYVSRTAVQPGERPLGEALKCTSWTDDDRKAAGIGEPVRIGEPAEPTADFEKIPVIIHLMLANIEAPWRKREYDIDHAWALAPVNSALTMKLRNVLPGDAYTEVEFWEFRMIRKFFSVDDSTGERKDGKVNQILVEAFLSKDEETGETWKGPGIRLTLIDGETCSYSPRALRPDGLARDSMPTPQTSIPWANQAFLSINRLFTNEKPRVLHVLLWWSVNEGEIDDVEAVLGWKRKGGNTQWGYSRSAARGGPALWVGSYHCLQPGFPREKDDERRLKLSHERCAKVIAHEAGHALGLHHVEDGYEANIMFFDPAGEYKSESRKGIQLSMPQMQQMVREAREQFRPR